MQGISFDPHFSEEVIYYPRFERAQSTMVTKFVAIPVFIDGGQ